jgi:RimJ/RimL family protein N-acetyltransferase
MGLDLADVKPRISTCQESTFKEEKREGLVVRQLFDDDLDELYRLQNCPESTKSSSRIPPTPKEKTKEWYESLSGKKGSYCLACFEKKKLLGYIRYQTSPPPFTTIWTEEFIVDANDKPYTTADVLLSALKDFKERYRYKKITVDIPVTCVAITKALEKQGFKKAGIMKAYSYIDEYYVDSAVYAYPRP